MPAQTQSLKGMCFKFALDFARQHLTQGKDTSREPVVVHGTVMLLLEKRRIDHAWVEFEGKTYDNIFVEGIDSAKYRKLLRPRASTRYTTVNAMVLAVRNQHYGPWAYQKP